LDVDLPCVILLVPLLVFYAVRSVSIIIDVFIINRG
jgi:hypothetical protein